MSPKSSRPQAVSAQSKPQSVPPQPAGSDGDRRHDQATEPSPVGKEVHWIDHVDELTWKIPQHADALTEKLLQLHALSYVLCNLGTDLGAHLLSPNKDDIEPIAPLAKLSLRLLEEVETHVTALDYSLHARAEEERT